MTCFLETRIWSINSLTMRESLLMFSAQLHSLPTWLKIAHHSACQLHCPHKSAEITRQVQQYVFRIWLTHAAFLQVPFSVPHSIYQAAPAQIAFQTPVYRTELAADFQALKHKQPFHGCNVRYSLPYSYGN